MTRSRAGWSAILVCLALAVALIAVGPDNLILTPAPIMDLVNPATIDPAPSMNVGSSDQTTYDGTSTARIVPGSQRVWGDGVRSPRPE